MKKLLIIGGIIFVVVLIIVLITSSEAEDNNGTPETTPAVAETPTPDPTPAVTEPIGEFTGFYQFTTIALSTSIDDAIALLGEPTSTMTMDVLGVESTTKSWWTINFFRLSTSETVTFTDGYATSVLSTADASSNISADDFSQISTGMTELEVYDILGMPYSVMIIEVMGTLSLTVSWTNADLSSGTVTFTNGIVSLTMDMGLN